MYHSNWCGPFYISTLTDWVRQLYQCQGGTFVPDPSTWPTCTFFSKSAWYMPNDNHLLGTKPHDVSSMAGEKGYFYTP